MGQLQSALENLFGSAAVLESCERELRKKLRDRGVLFGDDLLPTYAYAFVLSQEIDNSWAARAERLIAAAETVAHRLVEDVPFFESMGLSKDGLEFVRIDPGYKGICVLCRPDGVPVGTDIKFVEINCDSPAMMMFLDIVGSCLLELEPFAPVRDKYKPGSAGDRLLATLVECYREFGGQGTPTIAIVDWVGQKTRYEHARLVEHFEARGYPAVVCDPRAFRLVDGKLHVEDRKIDLVYRRALASEIIERRSELQPLLRAYKDGTICMVNPLRSYVASAKSLLTHLAMNGAGDCIPRSVMLDTKEARDMVSASASQWVLKKSESHGGEAVVLPDPANTAAWHAALEASTREIWIAQEYLDLPRLAMPLAQGNTLGRSEKYYNWNPFVFGGRYAGGMVRVSETPLINICLGGGLLPTFTM